MPGVGVQSDDEIRRQPVGRIGLVIVGLSDNEFGADTATTFTPTKNENFNDTDTFEYATSTTATSTTATVTKRRRRESVGGERVSRPMTEPTAVTVESRGIHSYAMGTPAFGGWCEPTTATSNPAVGLTGSSAAMPATVGRAELPTRTWLALGRWAYGRDHGLFATIPDPRTVSGRVRPWHRHGSTPPPRPNPEPPARWQRKRRHPGSSPRWSIVR